jgi:D-serine deaminase-like pyridoxal phosphate-dependent protein
MNPSVIGCPKSQVDTPALVIDLDALEYNISKMAEFFKGKEAKLRPHVKTHKTPAIALKQLEEGSTGITCQKLSEAEVMARAGIRDILIANQIVSKKKIRRLVELAKDNAITVAVDSSQNVEDLSEAAAENRVMIGVLVEVDIGMNRCGVPPGEPAFGLALKVKRHKSLRFMGLMGYEGHTVSISSYADRNREASKALRVLVDTRKLIEERGVECAVVSAGGTGTYDIAGSFPGITEVQAGSYVTMDAKYGTVERIGGAFKQALSLLATVISKPSEDRVVIDAGMKAISHEFGMPILEVDNRRLEISSLAEEHGIIKHPLAAQSMNVGDVIELIPTHGCTTINLHDFFYGIRKGMVEVVWPIEGRGKFH